MKKNRSRFPQIVIGLLLFCIVFAASNIASAQKVLNQTETAIVEEARHELQEAISNPDLQQVERLRLVERSAKTLKEYGQASAFPAGDIPLKKLFEKNYNQCQREFKDANELDKFFSTKLLDQQLKIINTLQIEVAEEQIKLMIPGLPAPYELSKDLVSTFFKWDIAEGFNRGNYGDAQSLVKRFNQLAQSKELIKTLVELKNGHLVSMQNLQRDLKMVDPLEAQLRKKYELAAAGTFTIRGYEGAGSASQQETQTASNPVKVVEPKLAASSDVFKETKFYFRLMKTETVKRVNKEMYIKSIEVSNNSMSASVVPPKPKEAFTTTANWSSPPSVIYPGDVVTLSAKGTGDARIRIEAGNSRSVFGEEERTVEGSGNSTVSFRWKVEGGSENMQISVHTSVTANTWGWTAAWFHYEYVVVE